MIAKVLYESTDSTPSLSRRELEVIQLLADGNSDFTIADKLFISPWTVKDHRKSLLKKMNAANTANAIYKACNMNLF